MEAQEDKVIDTSNLSDTTPIPDLLSALHSADEALSEVAVAILRRLGEKALEIPRQQLEEDDGAIRAGAAWTLGMIGHLDAASDLIKALDDEDLNVSTSAAWALGKIGDKWAIPALVAKLANSKQADLREAAARALGDIGDKKAVKGLSNALKKDKHFAVREMAARSLGRIGGKRVSAPLEEALADNHTRVRKAAAAALSQLESSDK